MDSSSDEALSALAEVDVYPPPEAEGYMAPSHSPGFIPALLANLPEHASCRSDSPQTAKKCEIDQAYTKNKMKKQAIPRKRKTICKKGEDAKIRKTPGSTMAKKGQQQDSTTNFQRKGIKNRLFPLPPPHRPLHPPHFPPPRH